MNFIYYVNKEGYVIHVFGPNMSLQYRSLFASLQYKGCLTPKENIQNRAKLIFLFPFQNIRIKHLNIPAMLAGNK